MQWYNCFDCRKVMPLIGTAEKKCLSCGSHNGEVISGERVEEGRKAGVFFDIDPSTGKRAKKSGRRR